MSKMRILHIGKSLSGIDTYIRLITSNLDSVEYESFVACGKNEVTELFYNRQGEAIQHFEVELKRGPSFSDFKAVIDLITIVKKISPSVIHCHTSKGGMVGRIIGAFLNIPTIYTPNAFSYLSAESKVLSKLYLYYEKIFSRLTSLLLACSESEYKRALNEVGYPAGKATFWNNCIDFPGERVPCEDYVVAIGRPSYQKNTDFMIRVFHEFIKRFNLNKKLIIVGVGHYSPLKLEVERLIRLYKLENHVELIPWMPRHGTIELLKKAFCYLSTSRYEGLSFANLEALAFGIPIIASKVDGNIECTKHGGTGFLIDLWNPAEYAEKIAYLFLNPGDRQAFSDNSIQLFREQFNIKNRITELEEIYLKFKK